MNDFYSTVRRKVKEQLFKDFSEELDFYYSLFPEETGSHLQFL